MRAAGVIDSMNGVTIAYAMGLVNALLGLIFAFGVTVTQDQRSYIVATINAALVFIAHVSHAQAKRDTARPTPTTESEG